MIHFDLHKLGTAELALGRLLQSDIPEDDGELLDVLDAPRFQIRKLLEMHQRAQAVLLDCQQAGRPLSLFLRNFSVEATRTREGAAFLEAISSESEDLQRRIAAMCAGASLSVVKLLGGSDAVLMPVGTIPALSTHSGNWQDVARELVSASTLIVMFINHLTSGVLHEVELLRTCQQQASCLIVVHPEVGESDRIREQLSDFPCVVDAPSGSDPDGDWCGKAAVSNILDRRRPCRDLVHSLNAEFVYVDPGFADTDEYREAENYLWTSVRRSRAVLHRAYWAGLQSAGVAYRHLDLPEQWEILHKLYAASVSLADFKAIDEVLYLLSIVYSLRGSPWFLYIREDLAAQYRQLAEHMPGPAAENREQFFAPGDDPLETPPSVDAAVQAAMRAEEQESRGALAEALHMYQVAAILALEAEGEGDVERQAALATILHDWAKLQSHAQQIEWAQVNYEYAASSARTLSSLDPALFLPMLADILNSLGALAFRAGKLEFAERIYLEAVAIRRRFPAASEERLFDLAMALQNAGMIKSVREEYGAALSLYEEALSTWERRVRQNPRGVIELTRQLIMLSFCVARGGGGEAAALGHARRAREYLPAVEALDPSLAHQFRDHVEQAVDECSNRGERS